MTHLWLPVRCTCDKCFATCKYTGKRVLELGCGCGMVGTAAYRGGAQSLWLTDGNAAALDNCVANLQRNDIPVQLLQRAPTGGMLTGHNLNVQCEHTQHRG